MIQLSARSSRSTRLWPRVSLLDNDDEDSDSG